MKWIAFSTMLFLVYGCGTSKSVTAEAIPVLSSRNIIKKHYDNNPEFKTLYARMKARYDDGKNAQSVSVNLRMERDKTIWLSASYLIPLAKVKITPNRVQFYEKIKKTYFDGDFAFLSEKVGTDLNFEKVQNLLLGQALFDLRDERYEASVNARNYVLVPERELSLFQRLFKVSPENFKMSEQRLSQPAQDRSVRVSYPSYQNVGDMVLPKEIKIESLDGKRYTIIEVDYRTVELNNKVTFPFSIPDGYDEILIK